MLNTNLFNTDFGCEMIFGKVTGTVISTRKSDTTEGTKYLLVQLCTQKETLKSSYLVALDLVGAGPGEMVIVSQGSSARQTSRTFEKPIDAVIAGIVDLVEEGGKVVYRKDKTA
jgi:microcompartment protein CcmK/EutM